MPVILSLALFERGGRTLAARRKAGSTPFAGEWLLPLAAVSADESAEEALLRHMFQELGVEQATPEFAETLYLEDAGTRYVANVFRVEGADNEPRFRAAGEYDDVRWLTKNELSSVIAVASLREWLAGARKPALRPGPERLPPSAVAPDNRRAWNMISRAYQDRYQLPTDRLVYSGGAPGEAELGLLGDVSDLKVIVLGCGAGQECIVLAKQGAQVVGVDLSDRQIEYGRRLAEREGVSLTLLQGNVEELRGVEDETQDLAVSLHAMNYVEQAGRAFREAYRVLKPGSSLVLSVHHPFDACLEDAPPFAVAKSYWDEAVDGQWDFPESSVAARMRSWYRPVSGWFGLLAGAGFRVERMLEPPPVAQGTEPWRLLGSRPQKAELVPDTLIIKAVKP
jgi:SAM-dependent methyltransferase/ADP-ribose pyrophosphatase YjhB (NUDIX family)